MIGKNEIRISTIIGKDADCGGDFEAKGSVRIDGSVGGSVTVSETLIVGVSGVISGNVTAKSVIIGGEVIGDVNAPVKTELTSTAKVIGNIITGGIVIDEHAIFQGRVDMNQEVSGKRPKPSAKALRAGKRSAKAAIEEALKEAEAAVREEYSEESARDTEEPAQQ